MNRDDDPREDCAGTIVQPRFYPAAANRVTAEQDRQLSGTVMSIPLQVGAGYYRFTWKERWTVPVGFNKYVHNPVYSPAQSPDWDSWTNGVSIIPHGDVYRMFYAGGEGEGIGLAEAPIDRPTDWQAVGNEPLLRPLGDDYEGDTINQPRVVKISTEHWRMYYTGWGCADAANGWCICAADSHDAGLSWKRIGRRPLLDLGRPGDPDDAGACVPTVIIDGERFRMWYTAVKRMPADRTYISLCYAESTDGLRWEKHQANPVLGPPEEAADEERAVISRPCVHKHCGVFRMWYSYARPRYRIHYAESLDGIVWESYSGGPVLDVSPAGWDSESVEYPVVDMCDGQFRLWYCGNGYGSVGYAEGEAAAKIRCRYRDAYNSSGLSVAPWRDVDWDQAFVVRKWLQLRVEISTTHALLKPAVEDFILQRESNDAK